MDINGLVVKISRDAAEQQKAYEEWPTSHEVRKIEAQEG
jgi:hypothetical protein